MKKWSLQVTVHCSFCTNIFVWSKLKQFFTSVSVKVVNIFLCIHKQLLNITNRGLKAPCKLYTISAKTYQRHFALNLVTILSTYKQHPMYTLIGSDKLLQSCCQLSQHLTHYSKGAMFLIIDKWWELRKISKYGITNWSNIKFSKLT